MLDIVVNVRYYIKPLRLLETLGGLNFERVRCTYSRSNAVVKSPIGLSDAS